MMKLMKLQTYIMGVMVIIAISMMACAAKKGLDHTVLNVNDSSPDQSDFFNEKQVKDVSAFREGHTGSLWVDSYNSNLYANMHRASKIGDTVTVIISEQASGASDTKTNTKRKSEVGASVDSLGGLMSKLQGIFSGLNPANLFSAKTENKFDGQGKINTKGQLFAQITCRVTERMNNGNLVIKGEKRIKVYDEEQRLVLEGMIRPYDITPNNTVSSLHVADARISFTGFGVIAERQKPGWLTRILDYVWPF